MTFEHALESRYLEGVELIEKGWTCGGIYLQGYAAEMVLKTIVFRAVGNSDEDEITKSDRERQVQSRGQHDPSSWLNRLLSIRGQGAPLQEKVQANLMDAVNAISENWSVNLRYRDIQPTSREIQEFTNAVDWIIMNMKRLS